MQTVPKEVVQPVQRTANPSSKRRKETIRPSGSAARTKDREKRPEEEEKEEKEKINQKDNEELEKRLSLQDNVVHFNKRDLKTVKRGVGRTDGART